MARKDKGRGDYRAITYPGYLHLPDALTAHVDFYSLNGSVMRLLIYIARQYNGRNNGDLCATLSLLKSFGWTSNDQITKAARELIKRDLLMLTRQGGLRMGCNLFAITWQPINECPGKKLDVGPTLTAPRSLRPIPLPTSNRPHLISVQAVPTIGAVR
jgi:hypothetical protein